MLSLTYRDDQSFYVIEFINDDIVFSKDGAYTTYKNIPKDDNIWFHEFLRERSVLLLPQIVEAMHPPRVYNLKDAKIELVKL